MGRDPETKCLDHALAAGGTFGDNEVKEFGGTFMKRPGRNIVVWGQSLGNPERLAERGENKGSVVGKGLEKGRGSV